MIRRMLKGLVVALALIFSVQVAQTPNAPIPTVVRTLVSKGRASYYGEGFHGKLTASGTKFNKHAMTAAHRYLPFGTEIEVYNPQNRKSVVVTITDRGPFVGKRIIDLSQGAARKIGLAGVSTVLLYKIARRDHE